MYMLRQPRMGCICYGNRECDVYVTATENVMNMLRLVNQTQIVAFTYLQNHAARLS